MSSQDSTDDRGMFRVGMLEPGEYIVAVPMDQGMDMMLPMEAMAAKEVAVARVAMAASAVAAATRCSSATSAARRPA